MRSSDPSQPSSQPAHLPLAAPGQAEPSPADQLESEEGLAFEGGCDPEDLDDPEHDDD